MQWNTFQPKKELNLICNNVGGAAMYYATGNTSVRNTSEKYHTISVMWNLRNKASYNRGKGERKREANKETDS